MSKFDNKASNYRKMLTYLSDLGADLEIHTTARLASVDNASFEDMNEIDAIHYFRVLEATVNNPSPYMDYEALLAEWRSISAIMSRMGHVVEAAGKYPQRDIHQEITDRLIGALEKGTVPWKKPWDVDGIQPTSVHGREYQGINKLLLGLTQQSTGYTSPHWVTFNQAKNLGGNIRRGEKGTMVTLWKEHHVKDKDAPPAGPGEEPKLKRVPLLRAYTVFNLDQTEGLDEVRAKLTKNRSEPIAPHEAVQHMLDSYQNGPKVTHALSDSAHYIPSEDSITIPDLSQWHGDKAVERHAATVAHELTHSTGHASRLDRWEHDAPTDLHSRAKEELTAELGSAFLLGHHGIDFDEEQTPAYIHSWLGKLNDDKKLIIPAAAAAQRAVHHILGTSAPAVQQQEEEKVASIFFEGWKLNRACPTCGREKTLTLKQLNEGKVCSECTKREVSLNDADDNSVVELPDYRDETRDLWDELKLGSSFNEDPEPSEDLVFNNQKRCIGCGMEPTPGDIFCAGCREGHEASDYSGNTIGEWGPGLASRKTAVKGACEFNHALQGGERHCGRQAVYTWTGGPSGSDEKRTLNVCQDAKNFVSQHLVGDEGHTFSNIFDYSGQHDECPVDYPHNHTKTSQVEDSGDCPNPGYCCEAKEHDHAKHDVIRTLTNEESLSDLKTCEGCGQKVCPDHHWDGICPKTKFPTGCYGCGGSGCSSCASHAAQDWEPSEADMMRSIYPHYPDV